MAILYPELFDLDAFKAGDGNEFNRICIKYGNLVKRCAAPFLSIKEDIEDAAQDTFMALQNANKSQFASEQHIVNYLCQVVRHKSISLLRRNKPHLQGAQEPQDLTDQPQGLADELRNKFVKDDFWADVDRYLTKLKPKLRETLLYFYKDDLDVSEIAAITKVSESTVYYRLEMAYDKLRELMDNTGGRIGLFFLSLLLAFILVKICALFGIKTRL